MHARKGTPRPPLELFLGGKECGTNECTGSEYMGKQRTKNAKNTKERHTSKVSEHKDSKDSRLHFRRELIELLRRQRPQGHTFDENFAIKVSQGVIVSKLLTGNNVADNTAIWLVNQYEATVYTSQTGTHSAINRCFPTLTSGRSGTSSGRGGRGANFPGSLRSVP